MSRAVVPCCRSSASSIAVRMPCQNGLFACASRYSRVVIGGQSFMRKVDVPGQEGPMTETTLAAESGTFTLGGEFSVRRLGYGAMQITGAGIFGEPADPDEARRVLQRAVELGVNFIDTAN